MRAGFALVVASTGAARRGAKPLWVTGRPQVGADGAPAPSVRYDVSRRPDFRDGPFGAVTYVSHLRTADAPGALDALLFSRAGAPNISRR